MRVQTVLTAHSTDRRILLAKHFIDTIVEKSTARMDTASAWAEPLGLRTIAC